MPRITPLPDGSWIVETSVEEMPRAARRTRPTSEVAIEMLAHTPEVQMYLTAEIISDSPAREWVEIPVRRTHRPLLGGVEFQSEDIVMSPHLRYMGVGLRLNEHKIERVFASPITSDNFDKMHANYTLCFDMHDNRAHFAGGTRGELTTSD